MVPLLIALVLLGGVQQSAAPPDVAEELMRLERAWNQAHEKGDAKAFEDIVSDDVEIALPGTDVLSKSAALELFGTGRMKFDRYETSDVTVRAYGDAAVVTGELMRTRGVLGVVTTDRWRFSKTYVRQSGRWRVVNFHASDAATKS